MPSKGATCEKLDFLLRSFERTTSSVGRAVTWSAAAAPWGLFDVCVRGRVGAVAGGFRFCASLDLPAGTEAGTKRVYNRDDI